MGEQITSTKSIDQNPFRSGRPFPWKRRVTLNCISSNWKIELLPSHNKELFYLTSLLWWTIVSAPKDPKEFIFVTYKLLAFDNFRPAIFIVLYGLYSATNFSTTM
ncbi:hypothetical protein RCL_jg424.t1 [Rhizophagus clarus]|uniref:Uncharacterized protein n=1 Tax=Rhizophagus clarus TaxID=94130 RepID=A0A8H3M1D3_9GLOM|nr:hypothetical protein RCL_jg424.t1 [Rhizophagus clarus]